MERFRLIPNQMRLYIILLILLIYYSANYLKTNHHSLY
nr:MAG TPA: hypothetical protein [Bacteriophage sp.]